MLTLLSCDLALFYFHGTELDSGTVAEFMLAATVSSVLGAIFKGNGDIFSPLETVNRYRGKYPKLCLSEEANTISLLGIYPMYFTLLSFFLDELTSYGMLFQKSHVIAISNP